MQQQKLMYFLLLLAPGKGCKLDKTNSEFVEDQRQREKEGRPNLGLSEEARAAAFAGQKIPQ